jgi:geranylgeranyl pyrophosphate synthase
MTVVMPDTLASADLRRRPDPVSTTGGVPLPAALAVESVPNASLPARDIIDRDRQRPEMLSLGAVEGVPAGVPAGDVAPRMSAGSATC